MDFDLGATYQINKLAIWNRSLKDVTVKVRTELNGPEQVAGSYTLFSRLSFPFSYAPDVLSFATTHQARYVRLTINSTHTFSPGDTFAYAIIGEIVVSATPLGTTAPTVAITLNPNGDVKLIFTGTLQTATNVVGTFDDVPGNAPSPFTLPKASLLPQQYVRAKSN